MNEGRAKAPKTDADNALVPIGRKISQCIGAPVKLKTSANGKGSISITFKNQEDLTRIMQLFDQLKK